MVFKDILNEKMNNKNITIVETKMIFLHHDS